MGGDTSGKTSSTNAAMDSSSTQDVWGGQAPYLEQMFRQGVDLGQQPGGSQQRGVAEGERFAGEVGGQLYDPLVGGYQSAFGPNNAYGTAAAGLTDPLVSGLSDIMNQPREAFAAGGNNPLLDQNVAMALEQASQNFSRNIAPSIGRDAQAMGQFGGSREGLALGTAAADANRDALRSAMGAYGDQYAGDRAANLASQAQIDATRLGAGQQIQDIFRGQSGNVGQGAATGMDLMNLGLGGSDIYGQMAQRRWDPLMNQANILGSPLVLGQTTSTGTTDSTPELRAGDIPGMGGGDIPGMGGGGGFDFPTPW